MSFDVITAVVAVAALILSIYNAVQARTEPARVRQRQLWDALRDVLQPLPSLMRAARVQLRLGSEISELPPELADVERRMIELGPRFVDQSLHSQLAVCAMKIGLAIQEWRRVVWLQERVESREKHLAEGKLRDSTEWVAQATQDRDDVTRQRDAAYRALDGDLENAVAEVDKWITRLDRKDRSD